MSWTTSRATPYPNGGELPEEYKHTLDPFVTLAAAVAVTVEPEGGSPQPTTTPFIVSKL